MTHSTDLIKVSDSADFARVFAVSRETMERLEIYADCLQRWQKIKNLVSPGTLSVLWERHMADSAQLLDLAVSARTWVDLGSGAGFPGMVLGIMLADKPGAVVHRTARRVPTGPLGGCSGAC